MSRFRFPVATTSQNQNATGRKPVYSGGAKVEEMSFIWKIENFEVICKSREMISPQQIVFEFGNQIRLPTKWILRLCLEIDNSLKRNYISGVLRLVRKPDNKDVIISFNATIRGSNGQPRLIKREQSCNMTEFCGKSEGLGFRICEQNADLEELHLLNSEGALVMEINLRLFYPVKPSGQDVSEKLEEFQTKFMRKLSSDLGKIGGLTGSLQSVHSSRGTKIISNDDSEFIANRGVLAARSDVFLRMFQTEMVEAATGEVKFEDVSSDTMGVLLHYLLTGSLLEEWKDPEILQGLAYAAHKYELDVLSEFLDSVLGAFCTKENSKELLVLAKKLNMRTAAKAVSDFIMNNAEKLDDLALDYGRNEKRPRLSN